MKKSLKLFPALLFISFLLFAVEAQADPLVITGGSATVTLSGHSFNFTGAGFRASGFGFASLSGCLPCMAGEPLRVSRNWAGESEFHSGPALLNGVEYAQLYYAGSITFDAAPLFVPAIDTPSFTLTTPFTLTGNMSFFLTNPFSNPGPPIFSTLLSGQGIAVLQMTSFISPGFGRLYSVQSITYYFQPDPVPEPATLLLLGTGLAGVASAVRKRRKKSSTPTPLT